jgi:hypothetical protein
VGWSIYVQLVRERPLDDDECKRLAAHARKFKLSRRSEPYVFRVAPGDAGGGVIAEACGKFGVDANPDEDADTERVYAALTELRTLIPGASLEVADDLGIVGWDGEQFDLVEDPDQELTPAPRDRSAWIVVPKPTAPRARPAAKPKQTKRGPLDEAIEAVAAGRPIEASDLEAIALQAFAAIEKASKAKDSERERQLQSVLAAIPAKIVVDAGLDARWMAGPATSSVGAALERLGGVDEVRERLLQVWFDGIPDKDSSYMWSHMGYHLMQQAMRDRQVVAALGAALMTADFEARRTARRNTGMVDLLAATADGLPHVIARRRIDRAAGGAVASSRALLYRIERVERPEVLPTLVLELARRGVDRDPLIEAMGPIDDARVLPLLERVLATDQYTRSVTRALLSVPGARAEALLETLLDHVDPFVRIVAAQGLVSRRGRDAIPTLLAAAAHARAAGIWDDRPPGAWSNTFRALPEALERIRELFRAPWPEDGSGLTIAELPAATGERASSFGRMLSPNPDVRRDALELAHREALAARDVSRIRALVAAERWHAKLCARADLPFTDPSGGCLRVYPSTQWGSWRKLTRMPFDPFYRNRDYTLDWLDYHADGIAPQIIPDELAAIAVAGATPPENPAVRLHFERDELAAWDAAERAFAAVIS